MNLDQGAGNDVDSSKLPQNLHELIPLISKWGVRSQVDQDEFSNEMKTRRPDEVRQFTSVVTRLRPSIDKWIQDSPRLSKDNLSSWNPVFCMLLDMLTVYELVYEPNAEEKAFAKAYLDGIALSRALEEANTRADDAFRNRSYDEVVKLWEPLESHLSESQKKKLDYARKQSRSR